ncbi:hypothetical protein L210DRAFT_3146832 [Boletus edulis BED1]|uniref:Uncharacterized protein n=1 Tax=Boletus edulis BED1 TaxID=1328754 RepID=A0AAD4GG27_BOLED|nr:hypothetical protein L210DRAFT_3146832 [Boletus edulis BED1]
MNSQEAFRRFAQQVQRAGGQGGGGFPGGPGRFFAGGGLLAALIGGGLLLNASLFNVDGGHRAIKYTRYEQQAILGTLLTLYLLVCMV